MGVAAALERLNPEDFALRSPDTYTALQVIQITREMARLIAGDFCNAPLPGDVELTSTALAASAEPATS